MTLQSSAHASESDSEISSVCRVCVRLYLFSFSQNETLDVFLVSTKAQAGQ